MVNKFVDRPSDIAELEQTLLPRRQYGRQKVFVLYGLGGIGKTQLAVVVNYGYTSTAGYLQ